MIYIKSKSWYSIGTSWWSDWQDTDIQCRYALVVGTSQITIRREGQRERDVMGECYSTVQRRRDGDVAMQMSNRRAMAVMRRRWWCGRRRAYGGRRERKKKPKTKLKCTAGTAYMKRLIKLDHQGTLTLAYIKTINQLLKISLLLSGQNDVNFTIISYISYNCFTLNCNLIIQLRYFYMKSNSNLRRTTSSSVSFSYYYMTGHSKEWSNSCNKGAICRIQARSEGILD